MDNDELETRLRSFYRSEGATSAPPSLAQAVRRSLNLRPRRRVPWLRIGLATTAVIAAVVVASRPGSGPVGAPSPHASIPLSTPGPRATPSATEPSVALQAAVVDGVWVGGRTDLWASRGSSLFVSADSGTNWRPSTAPAPIAFALSGTHAWAIGPGPGSTPATGSSTDVLTLIVYRTANGGETWERADVPGNYAGTVQTAVFRDELHGYLLASALRGSSGTSSILRTSDGGKSWTIASSAKWLGSELALSPDGSIWAGAQPEAGPVVRPFLSVSRDDGSHWQVTPLPALPDALYMEGPPVFRDGIGLVSAADLANSRTLVYETRDYVTWEHVATLPVEGDVASIVAIDATHWCAPGRAPGSLTETTDGGASWHDLEAQGLPAEPIDWLSFATAGDAAAVVPLGDSPASLGLFLSLDGGRTWTPASIGR